MNYEDMRNEFYYLKDENITNLDTKDLPGERWVKIFHNGDWFITELSNYGRFRIKNRIIKRMIDSVPFGLISILYRDIKNDRGNNKSLFIHAIDVMRSCREYYGDEMFDINTSNDTTIEEPTIEEPTIEEPTKDNGTLRLYDAAGHFVEEFNSIKEFTEKFKVSYTTACNSLRDDHLLVRTGGYLKRKQDVGELEVIPIKKREKNINRIVVLDSNYKKVGIYRSGTDAAKDIHVGSEPIKRIASGNYKCYKGSASHYYKGYYFYREDEYLKKFIYKEEDNK